MAIEPHIVHSVDPPVVDEALHEAVEGNEVSEALSDEKDMERELKSLSQKSFSQKSRIESLR